MVSLIFEVNWDENESYSYRKNDLKYFRIFLSKPKYTIKVSYVGRAWVDRNDLLKKYQFQYSLYPAKFWSSFGTLDIKVVVENPSIPIHCNLGEADDIKENCYRWHFNSLPADELELNFNPPLSGLQEAFTYNGPYLFAGVFLLLCFWINVAWILKRTKTGKPTPYFSSFILPSIIVPLIAYFIFDFSFPFLDYCLGEHASKYHGYYFLMIVIVPVIWVVYWVLLHTLKLVFVNWVYPHQHSTTSDTAQSISNSTNKEQMTKNRSKPSLSSRARN